MTGEPVVAEGVLAGLEAWAEPGADGAASVRHGLRIGEHRIALGAFLNVPVALVWSGRIVCRHCRQVTRKSYADGYCYTCFKRLAQCDLCVVSPDRCHYHLGTCREPAWGAAFCMHPHLVYVANSAGLKVGITREGNLPGRWIDQGATQAIVVMRTRTRHQAGCLEAALARHVADRTDWRLLSSGDAPALDLGAAWQSMKELARDDLDAARRPFGADVTEETHPAVSQFVYPVASYPSDTTRLKLGDPTRVEGRLVGVKGQYLLFDSGVLNVRQHTSYHVRLLAPAVLAPRPRADQLKLF